MKQEYKALYQNIKPAPQLCASVLQQAEQRRKPLWKKAVAVCAALALLLGGGYGANALYRQQTDRDLTVMVVYADDGRLLRVGSETQQPFSYGLYFAPEDDKAQKTAVLERYAKDWEQEKSAADALSALGESTSVSKGTFPITKAQGDAYIQVGVLYTLESGFLALSLDDYTQVKSLRVENKSEYGILQFDYLGAGDAYRDEMEALDAYINESGNYDLANDDFWATAPYGMTSDTHAVEVSGAALQESLESGTYACGSAEHEVNFGYSLAWHHTKALETALAENPQFDLSKLRDKITFTVTYTDGSVETASVQITFDRDGYMQLQAA